MAKKKVSRTRARVKAGTTTRVMVGVGLLVAAAAAAAFGAMKMGLGTGMLPTIVIGPSATASTTALLLPSTTNAPAGGFALVGRGDMYVVDTITFTNCVATADTDGDCADAGEVVGDSSGIQSAMLQYTDKSGITHTSTAVPVGDTVSFTGLALGVPKGIAANVSLFVTTNDFSTAGVSSGAQVQYNLNAISETFSGTSITHGVAITQKQVRRNALGTVMTERYSRPEVVVSSSSPSGTLSIPGVAGELLRFTVAADSVNDVYMTGGAVKVSVSDNDGTGWADCAAWGASGADIVNRSTGDSTLFTAYDTSGAPCAAGNTVGYFVFSVPLSGSASDMGTVLAGSTATYSVYTDFDMGIGSTGDMIRASIPDEGELDALGVSFNAFTWNDGVATSDIDGTDVADIPVLGNSLLFP